MNPPSIEILGYEATSLGPLCLRRRWTLAEPPRRVTEITLNHEFLMSSLHTDSERALATIPLGKLEGDALYVLIGGLGLGYTARSALADRRVANVEVVEFLPAVIRWLHDDLTPLAGELNAEPRLSLHEGDIYCLLLEPPTGSLYDAILIDVDHSPDDPLSEANRSFYTVDGLSRASRHLRADGILGLWSYDSHTPLLEAMRQVFDDVQVHPITYFNEHVREEFTDWLYVGRRAA